MKLLSIEYIPGVEFEALGIVKGTVVQTKNVGKDFMAGMKTLVGGEITGYTEMLAHTLTVIRRRMRENGQFILSVEPPTGDNQLRIGTVKTGDGKVWWAAFTSFEEELKGGGSVQSTFLTDIDQLFHSALQINEIEGIILNPWNRTIMLDKNLINIILGNV